MPSKDRDGSVDVDIDEIPRERRSTRGKGDRDRDRDRERRHHKSHRSSNPVFSTGSYVSQSSSVRRHKNKDRVASTSSKSRLDDRLEEEEGSVTDSVPELNRDRERVNIPYPNFSKAHSREAVTSRDDVSSSLSHAGRNSRTDPLTPEATDLGAEDEIKRSKSVDNGTKKKSSRKTGRPPSPPDTNLSAEKKRVRGSLRGKGIDESRPHSRTSQASRPSSRTDERSRVSLKSKSSSQATYIKPSSFMASHAETEDTLGSERGASSTGTSRPNRRSVSGHTLRPPGPESNEVVDDSPDSLDSSSPKTPTNTTPQFPPPMFHDEKQGIPHHIRYEPPPQTATPATDFSNAPSSYCPPPPPPPPPLNIQEAPRVDYLMQNGGLPNIVPKNFLAVLPRQNGHRPTNPPLRGAETVFAPFFNLLDQYSSVLTGHGSIAVATGHRTVARRLLDRLENVFNRDLPEEGCNCIMCERDGERHRGLGWGEVLERVSGRVEIPSWPPFDTATLGFKAAEDDSDLPPRPASPVKIDPDVAEEFREHYLRQSKKVKAAVDRWLTSCAEAPAPPPQEVDDETLTFAILTSLDQEDRPYFNALFTGARELQPALRAPTPLRKPRTDFVVKSGLALQRLYRLPQAPRDAETVCYLVKHSQIHDLLSTICDINPPEWEILISGRFDGFLWSGAEAADDEAVTPTAGPSRGPTPNVFPSRNAAMSPNNIARYTPALNIGTRATTPFSRGPTPASFVSGASSAYPNRQAVSNDEESEIAVLAELEREIYIGMEALEDAFESLHQRAEHVRTALRQRGAGLSMSFQQRRGYGGMADPSIQVLPQSGGSNSVDRPSWADEESLASEASADEWGISDDWELRPDDSASNISSSRQRRPRRRDERRGTPAPIREEEEG